MISKKVIITLLIIVFLPVLTVFADKEEPVANYYFVDFYGKGPKRETPGRQSLGVGR